MRPGRPLGTLLALGLVLACGVPAARDAASKIEAFFRVTPPALQTAYGAALKACVDANVRDKDHPTTPEIDAAEACSAEVRRVWSPIWDAFALVDQGCDLAPALCKEPQP